MNADGSGIGLIRAPTLDNAVIRGMDVQPRHLFILCSNFPFGFGEPFLELELRYLRAAFGHITICASESDEGQPLFNLPEGVRVVSVRPKVSFAVKLRSLFRLFYDRDLREELAIVRDGYHSALSLGMVKTMVVSKLRALRISRSVGKLLPTDGASVFLYSYWADDNALALALIKEQRPEVTAFCRVHGWDVYFERSAYHYLPFRAKLLNGLDAVFAISENGQQYLLHHFGHLLKRGRILQSRLGIIREDASVAYDRQFRRFRMVSCSNLIPLKRVELIVESLARIEGLEVEWTHFGDGPELPRVREIAAKRLGPMGHIAFHLPGRVPNWNILKFYSEHTVDLFISLSRYDGIPVSIMEAMSFGIPAMATDVGGVSEIVRDGVTGRLLPVDTEPAQVAKHIMATARMDDAAYRSMRQEAARVWGTFYSADINYPRFVEEVLSISMSSTE